MKTIKLSPLSVADESGYPRPGVITSLHELLKAGYTLALSDVTGSVSLHTIFENEGITFVESVKTGHILAVDLEKVEDDEGNDTAQQEASFTAKGSETEAAGGAFKGTAEDAWKDAAKGADNDRLKLTSDNNTWIYRSWKDLAGHLISPSRRGSVKRDTQETRISIDLNLDGTGAFTCDTGLGFFDHMLEQIARHGEIDLNIQCDGDLHVDEHHTVEDVALALGTALDQAFGDRHGIERYGFVLPMDESRSTVAIDLSGRPYLVFEAPFTRDKVGDLPTEMVRHFFYSLAMNLRATLHIEVKGENDHHMIEACFKGFARCLKAAKQRTGSGIPSSKGVL